MRAGFLQRVTQERYAFIHDILDWLECLVALTSVLSVIHGFQKTTERVPSDGVSGFMNILMSSALVAGSVQDMFIRSRDLTFNLTSSQDMQRPIRVRHHCVTFRSFST